MSETADPQPPDLGRGLSALLRAYVGTAGEALKELPGGPRGYQVLSMASSDTCRNQADIAATLGLDRTVMTYLVDDLEQAGLVERRLDPDDRRARQVVLTARGRKAFTAATKTLRDVERHLLAGLDEEESATFRDLLQRVTADSPASDAGACDGPAC